MAEWDRFKKYYLEHPDFDFSIDVSEMSFTDKWIKAFEPKFKKALQDMKQLEKGAISNPDENRQVGHYWLRNPNRAPSKEQKLAIEKVQKDIEAFTKKVLQNKLRGQKGYYEQMVIVGIGGSALGPQFIDHALRPSTKGLKSYFLDNTDPDGIDRTIESLNGKLGQTLVIVISKSGGTKETRNGMLEIKHAYQKSKLSFSKHAIAITGEGSQLFQVAKEEQWLATFPMWDWVGGRTSVMSAVGLLPAALSGFNIRNFLKGASEMDQWSLNSSLKKNPAALLSSMWFYSGNGKGTNDMVILPYKDRLELFSRYLQQLIMESLGKRHDLRGKVVYQGISVFGNKGSTDQHAYIQQLRDGLNNFFAIFLEVKKARKSQSIQVEKGVTSGDFLEGFFLGTRKALSESKRQNITITIDEVDEKNIGRLIALFERAVGFYASYVNINAYHQPGVEAGKKAAQQILELKADLSKMLKATKKAMTASELAKKMSRSKDTEVIFKLLQYSSQNSKSTGIRMVGAKKGVLSQFKSS